MEVVVTELLSVKGSTGCCRTVQGHTPSVEMGQGP